jgi:hypothetical protein
MGRIQDCIWQAQLCSGTAQESVNDDSGVLPCLSSLARLVPVIKENRQHYWKLS